MAENLTAAEKAYGFALTMVFFMTILLATALNAQQSHFLADGTQVAPLEMFQECDVCPEMIALPMGEFRMGSPIGESTFTLLYVDGYFLKAERDDPRVRSNERPLHQVRIDLPIAMGRNEVTYEEWMTCVEAGGCGHVPRDTVLLMEDGFAPTDVTVRGKHPVMWVSYLDALEYVAWLNSLVGEDVYRLPTDAEWEYAARAGTQTPFAQGESVHTDQVNFNGNAKAREPGVIYEGLEARAQPVPVDTLDAANAWGLRHMSGNVAEMTSSCFTERYLGWSTASEWLQRSVGEDCKRTTRGGSFHTSMDFQRPANRGNIPNDYRTEGAGFRVLRELN